MSRRAPQQFVCFCAILVMSLVCGGLADVEAQPVPFSVRRPRGLRVNLIDRARTSPSAWPREPTNPESVDIERFALALNEACGVLRPGRALRMATRVVRSAAEFGVDPFLLAGLLVEQSFGSCRTPDEGLPNAVGVAQVQPDFYRQGLHKGRYQYFVIGRDRRWTQRSLPFRKTGQFYRRLLHPAGSIYFSALFLRSWAEQAESLHQAFAQEPHRHFVSHFVWGDRVKTHRNEDRILTARRRLLERYGVWAVPTMEFRDTWLRLPLDGAPRVVTSGLGSPRDGGARRHRGVDFDSLPGEPVRAVASGRVAFAGMDLPGRQLRKQLRVRDYEAHQDTPLGNAGRFVCVNHGSGAESFRTCYMHLQEVWVEAGDELTLGDLLGAVGRSGMKRSAAHLHFELHSDSGILDPEEILAPLLVRPLEGTLR